MKISPQGEVLFEAVNYRRRDLDNYITIVI